MIECRFFAPITCRKSLSVQRFRLFTSIKARMPPFTATISTSPRLLRKFRRSMLHPPPRSSSHAVSSAAFPTATVHLCPGDSDRAALIVYAHEISALVRGARFRFLRLGTKKAARSASVRRICGFFAARRRETCYSATFLSLLRPPTRVLTLAFLPTFVRM